MTRSNKAFTKTNAYRASNSSSRSSPPLLTAMRMSSMVCATSSAHELRMARGLHLLMPARKVNG